MPNQHELVQDPAEMQPGWTMAHREAAHREGWDIFECSGSAYGPWQIQGFDDASDVPGAPQLESDDAAWRLVLKGTGPHHAAALAFLKAHNEIEYEAIMDFADKHELGCA